MWTEIAAVARSSWDSDSCNRDPAKLKIRYIEKAAGARITVPRDKYIAIRAAFTRANIGSKGAVVNLNAISGKGFASTIGL
jgi:hypothetical protein